MKKVFVRPEMKSYKLRGNRIMVIGSGSGEDNPGAVCVKEMQDCKPAFGCFGQTNSAVQDEEE